MKRRRFMQALAATPVVPALIAQEETPASAPAGPAVPAVGRGAGRGGGRGAAQPPAMIDLTEPDVVAETRARFFAPAQFSALEKLCDTLLPPMRGNPGAIQCGTPEFLDFLVGVSPADRKQLYRNGLDSLNAKATAKFTKPFAQLDAKQIDAIIRPLLVPVPWTLAPPAEPMLHFMAQVRNDVSTATENSRTWAETSGAGRGRGRGGGGGALVWLPIDPIYKS